MKKTRRIRQNLVDFFGTKKLTFKEKQFISNCLKYQEDYPQLSNRQWEIIMEIKKRYE